jgi:hypothetical protein
MISGYIIWTCYNLSNNKIILISNQFYIKLWGLKIIGSEKGVLYWILVKDKMICNLIAFKMYII